MSYQLNLIASSACQLILSPLPAQTDSNECGGRSDLQSAENSHHRELSNRSLCP
jgi:hypothetical protein